MCIIKKTITSPLGVNESETFLVIDPLATVSTD